MSVLQSPDRTRSPERARSCARIAQLLAVGFLVVASCGGASGPDGTSTTFHKCAPYNGTRCQGVQYPNYFQCDVQPGAQCVTAPGTSPDPTQTVWCCAFPCSRGDPATDPMYCPAGRALYNCNPDAKVDPTMYGCVPGQSPSVQICC